MIEVKNLEKTWRRGRSRVGLHPTSFTVPDGQIVGILGDNGAGKTTLLRSMAGLLHPNAGAALFDGKPAVKQYERISYITGEGSYYPNLTVVDYYLMDEPFLGKDVFTRKDFIKLMSAVLHGQETILITTHYLDDIEHFLDRAIVLHQGKIADDFMMEELQQQGQTLVDRMAKTCGWDPQRYLQFGEEEG